MKNVARLQKQFEKLVKDSQTLSQNDRSELLNFIAGKSYNALNTQANADIKRYAIIINGNMYVARICSYEEQGKIIEVNAFKFPENKMQEIDAFGRVLGDPNETPPISLTTGGKPQ